MTFAPCPVTEPLARLPLFPRRQQVWLLAVDGRIESDDWVVQRAFDFFSELIPGGIGTPRILPVVGGDRVTRSALNPQVASAPDELATPEQMRLIPVTFRYDGAADEMPWPAVSHRHRRERLSPTCPVPPLLAFPISVGPPLESDNDDGTFARTPPFNEIPFDAQEFIPQLPPAQDILNGVKVAVGVGVAFFLAHVLTQLFGSRR